MKLTYGEWLQYWWSLPSSRGSVCHMYSDEQYWAMMEAAGTGSRVADMSVSDAMKKVDLPQKG